jgi:hypothetical protein
VSQKNFRHQLSFHHRRLLRSLFLNLVLTLIFRRYHLFQFLNLRLLRHLIVQILHRHPWFQFLQKHNLVPVMLFQHFLQRYFPSGILHQIRLLGIPLLHSESKNLCFHQHLPQCYFLQMYCLLVLQPQYQQHH